MTDPLKEFLIKRGFFVEVRRDAKYNNVCYAKFPPNVFLQLEPATHQYYFEDNSLICTNLHTKKSKNLHVSPLNKRVVFLCDIILQASKRGIPLELIVGIPLDQTQKSTSRIIDFIDQNANNLDNEQNLINIVHDIINESVDEKQIKGLGLYTHYQLLNSIFESGGLL